MLQVSLGGIVWLKSAGKNRGLAPVPKRSTHSSATPRPTRLLPTPLSGHSSSMRSSAGSRRGTCRPAPRMPMASFAPSIAAGPSCWCCRKAPFRRRMSARKSNAPHRSDGRSLCFGPMRLPCHPPLNIFSASRSGSKQVPAARTPRPRSWLRRCSASLRIQRAPTRIEMRTRSVPARLFPPAQRRISAGIARSPP